MPFLPQGGGSCEAEPVPPSHDLPLFSNFVITDLLNIRGFLSKQTELEGFLKLQGWPTAIALNETFLDYSVEDVEISGFSFVSRRDRADAPGGGIALFVRQNVAPYATLLEHSATSETS